MTATLSGIIPPMITPLRARDELDHAGLERLIEHLISGGVSGLFLLGTTGEGPALGARLRAELVERTCRQVNGRVPVLVCVTDTAFTESLNVARAAADAGADALVAAPPFYWPLGQPEMEHYFDALAGELPLPLVLYNMPALTKTPIPVATVRRAMDNPKIIGMKDSSGNLGYLHQILRARAGRTDWPVLVGDEETLPYAMQAGADGGVNGGANVFPRLYAKYFQAAVSKSGDLDMLHPLVIRMGDLYRNGSHASSGIKGIKCALSLLGICDDFMAEPFERFSAHERERVASLIEEQRSQVP
ncbi:MAG: dihydrodipicolinate synthase family protein [Chthoniobacteraceae bacterium]